MHVRLFGRDFRLMSALLNLVVDLLFHISINDMWFVFGDQLVSSSVSHSSRQARSRPGGKFLGFLFEFGGQTDNVSAIHSVSQSIN